MSTTSHTPEAEQPEDYDDILDTPKARHRLRRAFAIFVFMFIFETAAYAFLIHAATDVIPLVASGFAITFTTIHWVLF